MLQEVYDWVGENESFPPYCTLHRGSMLVSHEETIERDETLNVTERVSRQQDLQRFQDNIFKRDTIDMLDRHCNEWS